MGSSLYPFLINEISEMRDDPSNRDTAATKCSPNELTHLRPLRTTGARPPLICVFPGPPGARDLAECLPDDQPVYEFHWPNMDRKVSFPSVEELAVLFLKDVRKVQAHGPFQFCGYSVFGLVAYEMAQLLLSEGEEVSFLALFDIMHPQFLQMLTRRELARYQVMRVIDRLGEYVRIMDEDDAASRLFEIVARKAKSTGWRAARFIFRRSGRPVPRGLQVIESIAANKAYVPKPYPERFMLIRAQDFRQKATRDLTLGWHLCATQGVDVYFVPGDHGTIKDKPFVHTLAGKITPHLATSNQYPK